MNSKHNSWRGNYMRKYGTLKNLKIKKCIPLISSLPSKTLPTPPSTVASWSLSRDFGDLDLGDLDLEFGDLGLDLGPPVRDLWFTWILLLAILEVFPVNSRIGRILIVGTAVGFKRRNFLFLPLLSIFWSSFRKSSGRKWSLHIRACWVLKFCSSSLWIWNNQRPLSDGDVGNLNHLISFGVSWPL